MKMLRTIAEAVCVFILIFVLPWIMVGLIAIAMGY
jgi:hypothetical protein